jgi:hypothetical protein
MELTLTAEHLRPNGSWRQIEVNALIYDFHGEEAVRLSIPADKPEHYRVIIGTYSEQSIAAWREEAELLGKSRSCRLLPESVEVLYALLNSQPLVTIIASKRGRVSALAA